MKPNSGTDRGGGGDMPIIGMHICLGHSWPDGFPDMGNEGSCAINCDWAYSKEPHPSNAGGQRTLNTKHTAAYLIFLCVNTRQYESYLKMRER